MTKRQDLCLQRGSRPEQSDQRQPNQPANISHQPRASPHSTSLASRIEFPTMTAGADGVAQESIGFIGSVVVDGLFKVCTCMAVRGRYCCKSPKRRRG